MTRVGRLDRVDAEGADRVDARLVELACDVHGSHGFLHPP